MALAGNFAPVAAPDRRWKRPRAVFERWLSLHHRHTGETLKIVYYAEGRYLSEAMHDINHFLRDYRTEQIKPIDASLLDLLHAVSRRLETRKPYEVYSGYRSPETNARLRRAGIGAARNSLHMEGKAIDVALQGVSSRDTYRAATSLKRGGVGYYGSSSFVHLDVGDVRTWRR
jgi:uncharacterized protein YcbK (DUF882 family)